MKTYVTELLKILLAIILIIYLMSRKNHPS